MCCFPWFLSIHRSLALVHVFVAEVVVSVVMAFRRVAFAHILGNGRDHRRSKLPMARDSRVDRSETIQIHGVRRDNPRGNRLVVAVIRVYDVDVAENEDDEGDLGPGTCRN